MDGLKLLDAFQPLEDGGVDDLLGQAGNLCQHWLSFNLTLGAHWGLAKYWIYLVIRVTGCLKCNVETNLTIFTLMWP